MILLIIPFGFIKRSKSTLKDKGRSHTIRYFLCFLGIGFTTLGPCSFYKVTRLLVYKIGYFTFSPFINFVELLGTLVLPYLNQNHKIGSLTRFLIYFDSFIKHLGYL